MALKTRIQIAKPSIIELFDNLPDRVFKISDIQSIIRENRDNWRLTQKTNTDEFLDFMLNNTKLAKHVLEFPKINHTLFTWGKDVSVYEIALRLGINCYLSHYSAGFILSIIDDVPKTIYVTVPQSVKRPQNITLSQGQIDKSFSSKPRITKNTAKFKNYRVTLLTGMDTQGLGISSEITDDGRVVRVTNIERTLIDMTIRPIYSGGVHKVLQAFSLAAGRLSTNKLVATYKKLNLVYPYHQAIGFYMERSGAYPAASLKLLKEIDRTQDFYLTHGMGKTDYSRTWRILFPKGM